MYDLIVTTTFGIEAVTKKEIERLGYRNLRVENGKIEVKGCGVRDIAILNTWLRTAERVFIKMAEFEAFSFVELFDATESVAWHDLIPENGKMHVVGKSIKSTLYSVPDCQAIVKKAIVKSMGLAYGRDEFLENGPVYKIEVAILKDVVTLFVDTSGPGLHKRGYREYAGAAPLKETLSAALVMMAKWDFSEPLIDPFCGSGTILIEGAMYAQNIAPGLHRSFVCENWPGFDADVFDDVRAEARDKILDRELKIFGYDVDGQVLRQARQNADAVGVGWNVEFHERDFYDFSSKYGNACLVTNPPYGERLADKDVVRGLSEMLGKFRDEHPGWNLNVFTAAAGFEDDFGQKASKNRKLYNGRILTRYYQYFAKRKK